MFTFYRFMRKALPGARRAAQAVLWSTPFLALLGVNSPALYAWSMDAKVEVVVTVALVAFAAIFFLNDRRMPTLETNRYRDPRG